MRTEEEAFDTPRLFVGAQIAPGRWGRLIAATGPTHPHFYREDLFEAVRSHEFPDRPSRLTCGYAWIGEPGWAEPDPTEHVYEVAYPGGDAFPAHMGYLTDASGVPLGELIERARAYWRGDGALNELLVPGELEVVAVIR